MHNHDDVKSRRRFLQAGALLGAVSRSAVAAQEETPLVLPTVKFGSTPITRLIVGSNPFYGYAHFNRILGQHMREWYTQERRMAVLRDCEKHGITTWQVHYNDQPMEDFQRYRAEGGRMHLILLSDFELMKNPALLPTVVKQVKPLGIAHHGNRTDERFRNGEKQKIKDYLKLVRDSGVMVGLSTHNPAVVDTAESENWDVDYYQTCLYRVSRTPEEMRAEYGEAPLGEIFMERDPARMTRIIRLTRKPCLAFKVLGAGRLINTPEQVERAFRFAYTNIKPTDAVIIGMYPRFTEEVAENTALVRRILTAT
jgi:hypothetical protein